MRILSIQSLCKNNILNKSKIIEINYTPKKIEKKINLSKIQTEKFEIIQIGKNNNNINKKLLSPKKKTIIEKGGRKKIIKKDEDDSEEESEDISDDEEEEEEESEEEESEEDNEEKEKKIKLLNKINKNDSEDVKKIKKLNKKLNNKIDDLKDENNSLQQKLNQIEELVTKEKQQYIKLLRNAFVNFINEVQVNNKNKDFVTNMLKLLKYKDEEIFDIYNSMGKKKGLFGFLK